MGHVLRLVLYLVSKVPPANRRSPSEGHSGPRHSPDEAEHSGSQSNLPAAPRPIPRFLRRRSAIVGLTVVGVVAALVAVGIRETPAESVGASAALSSVSTPASPGAASTPPVTSPVTPSGTSSSNPSDPAPTTGPPSSQGRSTPKPQATLPQGTLPQGTLPKTATPKTAKPGSEPLKIAAKGPGTYVRAGVAEKWTSEQGGRVLRYDVRIEKGLPFDATDTARTIQKILDDPRSWTGSGEVRWRLVKPGQKADLHAYVVTPKTTDKLCAPLLTRGNVSCQNGKKVVLNAKRWAFGAKAYGKDVVRYRQYLVNHEFGHALGRQHVRCPGRGDRGPVMLQQTKGLRGCKANPWPSPKRT